MSVSLLYASERNSENARVVRDGGSFQVFLSGRTFAVLFTLPVRVLFVQNDLSASYSLQVGLISVVDNDDPS